MISLFITCLLSFFCCSGITFNALDSTQLDDNNVVEYHDLLDKGLMYVPYGDDYVYCASNSDFHDTRFVLAVYNILASSLGTNEYVYDHNFKCQVVDWEHLDLHYFETQTPLYFVDALSVTCQNFQITEYGKLLSNYRIRLHYTRNGSLQTLLYYDFSYIYPASVDEGYYNNGILIYQNNNDSYFYCYDTSMNTTCNRYFAYDIDEASYQLGKSDGQTIGYREGYQAGIDYNNSYNATARTIFTGIIDIGLLPVNIFLQILNFEVFGINIGGLVSAFLTIAIVIIIVRVVTGKKND